VSTSFSYFSGGWNRCYIAGAPDAPAARPPAEKWAAFWALVDALDAWSWKGDYGAHIVSGSPWVLTLERDGREVSCKGNGPAAPPGFDRLYDAMMALARDAAG
jgi:hypothetical protein